MLLAAQHGIAASKLCKLECAQALELLQLWQAFDRGECVAFQEDSTQACVLVQASNLGEALEVCIQLVVQVGRAIKVVLFAKARQRMRCHLHQSARHACQELL